MEPSSYRREDHEHSCPCKLCVTFDIVFAVQEMGLDLSYWRDLPGLVTREREKKLNWDLPIGHCLMCGGTKLDAWSLGEHYQITRFNTKEVEVRGSGVRFYTSLMLHVGGPMYGVYREYLEHKHGWGKLPIPEAARRFRTWASHLMDLSPEKCIGVASRDHGDWLEIRLGYTELVEENREQRIERFIRDAERDNRERSNLGAPAVKQGSRFQAVSSLAWGINTVLAPVPGRVSGAAEGSQDPSRTNDRGG